jgi:DMSO/TMAO reductase YedYZ molybdopterin-dependent catalytic subunit
MSGPTHTTGRRGWLKAGLASLGGLALAGCEKVTSSPGVQKVLASAEGLTRSSQRLILSAGQMAPEYKESDLSPTFKANGSVDPQDPAYLAHVTTGFANWRLKIDGLVERPMELSLDQLKARKSRTQITRHDCVEGWSCVGKWTGAPLADLIREVGLKPEAKFLVFHCMDTLGGSGEAFRYYESIALADVFHPQTLLAYAMNDGALTVPHGAPLRLRVERHLGYKQAKYIERIEAVATMADMRGGRGGYWPDRGYEWYAGI